MNNIIEWLLDGDISVQYQVHKFLLRSDAGLLTGLQKRIESEGFGAELLSKRSENGHWGRWFYQPKWTSTHYTLTDLKNLGMPASCAPCREMVSRAFDECQLDSGGVNFAKSMIQCDICVDGMILDYAAYFCPDDLRCEKLAGFLLGEQKEDGGFGWSMSDPKSDTHTTISVLEGLLSYKSAGFTNHSDGIEAAGKRAVEYLFSNG